MPQRSSKMIIKTTRRYWKYLYIVLGVAAMALGIICAAFSSVLTERFIDSQMVLRPNSEVINMWKHPDVNISIDFHFFNWTNPKDFYNMSSKPILNEVGPYSYTEVPIKKIFKWHPENNTMDYGKAHLYYFNKERTNGSLDDTLVSLNALLVTAASKSKNWSLMRRTVIDMALKFYHNGIVWQRSADEFFFKGFKDDIVNLVSVLPASFRSSLGILIPWDRIGYSYARNGSVDFLGVHSIYTGVDDMSKYGMMAQWKYKNYTDAFGEECNAVQGSAGEFQKTNLKKNESLTYFFTDFCRAVRLDYFDEVTVEGVIGYRYKISRQAFDNGTYYPESKCYCNGECLPYGAFNISSCWFGLPIFVSQPHFLDADPYYGDQVVGMKPNKSQHETTITLEPRTGYMLELVGRLQINIHAQPSSHIKMFPNKRNIVFPVIWFDMHARITKTSALILKLIHNMALYGRIFGVVVILLGALLLLWRPCKNRWNKRYVHHMEINNMGDDDYDMDEPKEISIKENLFGLPSSFPSLMYITHPRRSLPIIISHVVDGDDEALKSCLEDDQRQEFELAEEECDTSLVLNS